MISNFEHFSDILKQEAVQDKTALICGEQSYTYRELRQAAELCASDLIKLGVKKGDHVGLWSYNSINWVITLLAIIRVGGVAVLINYNFPSKHLVPLLIYADTKFLAYGLNRDTKLDMQAGEQLAVAIGIPGKTYCIAEADYKARIESGECPAELPEEPSDANADAVIIFTSGTTAMPKAVLLSQKAILNNGCGGYAHINKELSRYDISCLALPLFHSYGLTMLIGWLQFGMTLDLISQMKPDVLIDAISRYHIGLLFSVGILNQGMLASPRFNSEVAPYLRLSILGGEFADSQTIVRLSKVYPDIVYLVGYGQSEAGPIISLNTPLDTIDSRAYTVGTPLDGTTLMIADPSSGEVSDKGVAGEVWVKSDSLMNGYYGVKPEKQAIDSDGWLHTGDLGYLDENGRLCLTGRLKDIIIKNGENISAKEIEKALLKCDGIQNAQVLGTPSAVSGEEIDACLMLKSNCRFDEKILRAQLAEYLPKFKMPERFFLFDAFPLDENGKVVSRILREKLESALIKG